MLLPAGVLVAAVFLPGRRVGRILALGVAATIPGLPEIGPTALRWGWLGLWLFVAWHVGRGGDPESRPERGRAGGVESGTVGLLLGLALLTLLVAAIARQNLSLDDTRRTSFALLFIGTGLLQLLVRRDARRAMLAFAGLGTGLQVLERAARDAVLPVHATPESLVVVASLMAVVLVARVAGVRERDAGSAWVSDAHDLHD